MNISDTDRIRALNDRLRSTGTGGWVVATPALNSLPEAVKSQILQQLQTYDAFDPDNDPDGEHNLGFIELDELRIIWKIDYCDLSMSGPSDDPADEEKTLRMLTIMLAEEY